MGKLYAILLPVVLNVTLSPSSFYAAIPTPPPIIPATRGTALDGHTVSLPHDLSTATILILGFSRNSADPTTAWEMPIRKSLASPPSIGFYDMPMLADAPGFVRPIIIHSIRKQVPDVLRPNFVPLTEDEPLWKQAAAYNPTAPDAPYILLVDRTGTVRWQTHVAFNPTAFAELTAAAHRIATETR